MGLGCILGRETKKPGRAAAVGHISPRAYLSPASRRRVARKRRETRPDLNGVLTLIHLHFLLSGTPLGGGHLKHPRPCVVGGEHSRREDLFFIITSDGKNRFTVELGEGKREPLSVLGELEGKKSVLGTPGTPGTPVVSTLVGGLGHGRRQSSQCRIQYQHGRSTLTALTDDGSYWSRLAKQMVLWFYGPAGDVVYGVRSRSRLIKGAKVGS